MYTKYSIVIQTGCDTEIMKSELLKKCRTQKFSNHWPFSAKTYHENLVPYISLEHSIYYILLHSTFRITAPRHCWLRDRLAGHLVSHITGSSIRNTWREEDRGRTGWAAFTWKTTNKKDEIIIHHLIVYHRMPSVLWCCWLGGRKGIRPVKTEWWGTGMVMSGVRCKWFAYGPPDATATPSSLASVKSRMVYLSGAGLPRLSWKKGR